MCGINCDTVSKIARPWLRDGVNASVTVSDMENHQAVEELQRFGGQRGSLRCGAAGCFAEDSDGREYEARSGCCGCTNLY